MSDIKIRVKSGDIEIEYTQGMATPDFPACLNGYPLSREMPKEFTKHHALIETIRAIADEVVKIQSSER